MDVVTWNLGYSKETKLANQVENSRRNGVFMNRDFDFKKIAMIVAVCLVGTAPLYASTERVLEKLVGYTIAESKTIEGFIDDEGELKKEFNGCEHGRKIVFTDGTFLTCATYSYTYSYRPTAFIVVRRGQIKMIVNNDFYDMRD
jgi:hypothetical protein